MTVKHSHDIAGKIATASDLGELEGMAEQMRRDGRITDEITGLIALRKIELTRSNR